MSDIIIFKFLLNCIQISLTEHYNLVHIACHFPAISIQAVCRQSVLVVSVLRSKTRKAMSSIFDREIDVAEFKCDARTFL